MTVAIAPTIDTHTHYFPESYLRLIAEDGRRCGTTVVTGGGKKFIQVGLLLRTGPYRLDPKCDSLTKTGAHYTLSRTML